MITFPNAKINIGLNILRKRADEFHDIESLFYPVAFFDVLELVKSKDFEFTSSGLDIPGYTANNLCIKAYNMIKNDYSIGTVKMHLHKVIPMGSGLGGGSSNGAFCINMLNELFELNIPIKKRINYAAQLGSDCPFFIYNQPTLATGRGDIFEEINFSLKGKYIVMVNPNIHISTAEAYRAIKPFSNRESVKDILLSKSLKGNLVNDFAVALSSKYSFIDQIEKYLYSEGAWFAGMSGSGSTMFGIFEKEIPELAFPDTYHIWKGILK